MLWFIHTGTDSHSETATDSLKVYCQWFDTNAYGTCEHGFRFTKLFPLQSTVEVSAAGDSRRRGHDGIHLQTPGNWFQPPQKTTRSLVRSTHHSCNMYLLHWRIQDFPGWGINLLFFSTRWAKNYSSVDQ